jgi:hypothetical protein
VKVVRGIPDALKPMGFPHSAGIALDDGSLLYAFYDERKQPPRIMIVAHPTAAGDMRAVELLKCTSDSRRSAGDLLDELVDPANKATLEMCARLAAKGAI